MTVTPANLGTYLGTTVDTARAQYLIDRATELCLAIVSVNGALPSGSDAVVLDVATRAYSNPSNATTQNVGPYGAGYGPVGGGLWLTRQNKAMLRSLAGSGGAFTIDTLPAGVNCVQTLTVSATAGTYTLTFNGQTTSALAYNAAAGAIQAALQALSSVGAGNVSVTGSAPYQVTFVGSLAASAQPLIAVGTGSLTGSASVAMTTVGAPAPPSGLPWWDVNAWGFGSGFGADWDQTP